MIGFKGRWDYAAIGSVTNQAARLCSEADSGQILVSQGFLAMVDDLVESAAVGEIRLRGFQRPLVVHEVRRMREG